MSTMNTIITPDQYEALYKYEKTVNPTANLVWKQYKKNDVQAVDRLVQLSRGRMSVTNETDWVVLEGVIKFFAERWPNEWDKFTKTIPDIRQTRGQGGYSKSKETKYVGAFPLRLNKIIKIAFPLQQFDKTFVNKFVKRFKIFKVGGEFN